MNVIAAILGISAAALLIYYVWILMEGDETHASIDSCKDLTVQGVGYLAVYNNIGHGLRSETLNVAGAHVYTDVEHDGIHGKTVNVFDGVFYFQKANDAFGTTETGQLLRWSQPAMAQESSFHIHDIRIAVEHARQVFTFTHTSFYQLQGIIRREHISGIHKHQVIACCPVDTLVHRIIESLVYAIHLNLIPHILHTAWHDDTIFYGERLCLVIAQDDLVGTV